MRLRILFLTAAGLALSTGPLAAQPTRVVLSGTAAPAGGNYFSFGNSPALNGSGQVAFVAALTGGSASEGIFAGSAGSIQAVALQGAATPGGNYSLFVASSLVLNGSGQVAFAANLTGGASDRGIFAGPTGSVQAVALRGAAAPAGGNYFTFTGTNPVVLNGSGQVAFATNLSGGTSSFGLFAGPAGALQTVALSNTPAPAGGNYTGFGTPAMNASGQVAFLGSVTQSSGQGIFVGPAGSLQTVALSNTAAPAGGNYTTFRDPVLNGSGQVAFVADLSGGSSTSGLFAGSAGSVQAVALSGTAAPGGGKYGAFPSEGPVVLNRSGQVAFYANLTGGASDRGIFAGPTGSVQAVALRGAAAPAGGNYNTFGTTLALNGLGQVAFLANLAGGTSAQGLFAWSAGQVSAVVIQGQVIDVDPGVGVDNRTVSGIGLLTGSGGEDGWGMSFNDSGLLAYNLSFTDGSSGIFTTQVAPVPEPAGVLLAAGLGLLAARARRRATGQLRPRPFAI